MFDRALCGQTRSRGGTDLTARASTIAGLDRRDATHLRFADCASVDVPTAWKSPPTIRAE